MKRVAIFLGLLGLVNVVGCSRAAVEAAELTALGDKSKDTNLDDAISKYEQASKIDPDSDRIFAKLARAYRKKEDWEKAAAAAQKAAKIAPTHAEYALLAGSALTQAAKKGPTTWADAKGPLETAIKLDANLAEPHHLLGDVLLHTDDERGALEHYTKAADLQPNEPIFHSKLAELYIRLGFFDQAEQVLREAVNYKDGNEHWFNVFSLYGQVLERKGDNEGALKKFEEAKKACGQCNRDGQQIAYFNVGRLCATLTRKSEAESNLKSFQKMICKGGAAQRYSDECSQAQEMLRRVSGNATP